MTMRSGEIILALALFFSFLQSVFPLWGKWRKNPYLLAFARPCAQSQFFLVLIAYLLLTFAFIQDDFSIGYVNQNSHASLPFIYKITAVWGAHEGSILLWILMLNIWSIAFAHYAYRNHLGTTQPEIPALTLAILGVISFCFLSFLIFTSNPFQANQGLETGFDLNPLLQDPGFVIHPPMLYLGYVGFSVAFALTFAALLSNKLDRTWAHHTKRFALAAWGCLTLGIALGSWWAYRVLGWGGFWFWDPVENASLLPWLAGTALIHVLVLVEKENTAKTWATLLAFMTFALSLLGTFLVRSGVIISVHAFANDPARGVFLLGLLSFLIGTALLVFIFHPALRTPTKKSEGLREYLLMANSALMIIACLSILLGTVYPLILDALHLGTISVGAPYFNQVMLPILMVMMIVMGIAPLSDWAHQKLEFSWRKIVKNLLMSLVGTLIFFFIFSFHFSWSASCLFALCLWVLLSVTHPLRHLSGMKIAHLGFAIMVLGILLSSQLNEDQELVMMPGNTVTVGPYQFLFLQTFNLEGPNYRGVRAAFRISKYNRPILHLYPEKRFYPVREMVMTKVAIHPGIFRDLYLALGEPLSDNEWSVRVYYKPFIRWIWWGGGLMMIGGFMGMMGRGRISGKNGHAHGHAIGHD